LTEYLKLCEIYVVPRADLDKRLHAIAQRLFPTPQTFKARGALIKESLRKAMSEIYPVPPVVSRSLKNYYHLRDLHFGKSAITRRPAKKSPVPATADIEIATEDAPDIEIKIEKEDDANAGDNDPEPRHYVDDTDIKEERYLVTFNRCLNIITVHANGTDDEEETTFQDTIMYSIQTTDDANVNEESISEIDHNDAEPTLYADGTDDEEKSILQVQDTITYDDQTTDDEEEYVKEEDKEDGGVDNENITVLSLSTSTTSTSSIIDIVIDDSGDELDQLYRIKRKRPADLSKDAYNAIKRMKGEDRNDLSELICCLDKNNDIKIMLEYYKIATTSYD
jgi:hypothetical protein